jgi:alpha-glucoside transport system substrate-binding protein
MSTKKLLAAMLLVLAMIATACNDSEEDDADVTVDEDAAEVAEDEPAEGGEAEGGGEPVGEDVSGEISILHAFTGEEDVAGLTAIIDAFKEQYPNITVNEEGAGGFESLARTRINFGQAPDIILHPQPGLLEGFVNQGVVQPVDYLDEGLGDELVGGLLDLSTFDGTNYGVPMRLSFKSLVWYNQPVFEEAGYEIPETWDELMALTEQIAADGEYAPWCIGIESEDATGWVATDWVEDILLRAIGPDAYDQWVAGELDFASEEVQGAIEEYMVPIWTNDEYVNGGRENITREAFGTAVNGILGGTEGECVLHRQATFIEGFITEAAPDAEFGTDYNFFYLPPIDEEIGKPALGAGDIAARYSDTEASQAFMEFLASPEAGEGWAELGGYLSPFTTFDESVYPTDSTREAAALLGETDFFRFDGSDVMPGDVGSSSQEGSFWLEMTEWASGGQELEQALTNIDELYADVADS